ncbi:hypothetical protein MMC22_003233 [Lobaria immixta]|nr:hypothetical protein [Lobaria immixta]
MSMHKTISTGVDCDAQEDTPEYLRDNISHLHLDSIAPNQLDAKYEASKYEFWAYCGWLIGNPGVALGQFAPIAFQNLLSQAAGTAGVLRFAGMARSINSIVLLCNGISFCIQVVVFLMLGSFAGMPLLATSAALQAMKPTCADFGTWRPNILIGLTVISIAIGFSWLGVHTADQWKSAAALYIIGCFARSSPALRRKAEALNAGDISRDEYDAADRMIRSKYLNIAMYVCSPAQVLILAVCVGILYALNVNANGANSNWGISVILAFLSGLCALFSLPWFIMEKRRPGQTLPAGMSIVRAGLWQWWRTASQVWRLKQTLFYLIGYFLLTDAFYTTITMVTTLQNEVVEYEFITLTELTMVGWAGSFFSIYGYWTVQHKYNLKPKTMYCWVVFCIVLLDVWGMIGIWTQKVGLHHPWEFWAFQGYWGLICPYYTYSQIMISEVTPRGKEFLFFSFFNLLGTTTSFIGPVVSSAIIDASSTRNNSLPFYFLTAVALTSFLGVLFFVNPDQSQSEQAAFLEDERMNRERMAATRMRAIDAESIPNQTVQSD